MPFYYGIINSLMIFFSTTNQKFLTNLQDLGEKNISGVSNTLQRNITIIWYISVGIHGILFALSFLGYYKPELFKIPIKPMIKFSILLSIFLLMLNIFLANKQIKEQNALKHFAIEKINKYKKTVADFINNEQLKVSLEGKNKLSNFLVNVQNNLTALQNVIKNPTVKLSQSEINGFINSMNNISNQINNLIKNIKIDNNISQNLSNDLLTKENNIATILSKNISRTVNLRFLSLNLNETFPDDQYRFMLKNIFPCGIISKFTNKSRINDFFSLYSTSTIGNQTTRNSGIIQNVFNNEIVFACLNSNGNLNNLKSIPIYKNLNIQNPFFHVPIFYQGKICDKSFQDIMINPLKVEKYESIKYSTFHKGISIEVEDSICSFGIRCFMNNEDLMGVFYLKEGNDIVNIIACDRKFLIHPRNNCYKILNDGLVSTNTNNLVKKLLYGKYNYKNENSNNNKSNNISMEVLKEMPVINKDNFMLKNSSNYPNWTFKNFSVFSISAKKDFLSSFSVNSENSQSNFQSVFLATDNICFVLNSNNYTIFVVFNKKNPHIFIMKKILSGVLTISKVFK